MFKFYLEMKHYAKYDCQNIVSPNNDSFQPWYQWLIVLNNSLNDYDTYPTYFVWRDQYVSHY